MSKKGRILEASIGYEKNDNHFFQTLVFTDTKRECDNLTYILNRMGKSRCAAIHGDKDQRERERVLSDFRNGRINVLVATDVAARGLGNFIYIYMKKIHIYRSSFDVYISNFIL